ncbi:Spermidine synthase-like protein [Xylanimonas cellulosilytica DSM 15894]|uniref:Spermidine synthase-like protein n=1 Tax=Xylanimonas cellulosilytica (strain DSM 15894 / JCM 12276 / CECT 5975 / KCTC 9989 / LMG 20990 / NBRC 107835 / XIL07) TaxID=446471 RepID=D1C0B0_XYLCX|nr:fused MFS/spermidine synthase [Xylanimonas cellulosilytica]ACZ30299.1 Spermidine synthase-like protein [Xylanimonas cellulosilytica DSM 15894]
MARRSVRSSKRSPSSAEPPTLPLGPVPIDTGTAEVVPDRDHAGRVTLQVNGVPSSYLDLDDPGFLAFEYMQYMDAVVAATLPGPLRALHLGAAGCALARSWDAARPGSRQLAIDVDARLVQLVREWFALPRAPRLRLRADDAAAAVATAAPASYDVVVRDVFAGDATPGHLVTQQVARQVAAALRPGGLYLVNCADRPPLERARRELATLAAAFGPDAVADGRLVLIAEPGILKGRRYGNLVLAAVRPLPATDDTDDTDDAEVDRGGDDGGAVETTSADHDALPDLRSAALARALRALPAPAHILTDDELARFAGTARPF